MFFIMDRDRNRCVAGLLYSLLYIAYLTHRTAERTTLHSLVDLVWLAIPDITFSVTFM